MDRGVGEDEALKGETASPCTGMLLTGHVANLVKEANLAFALNTLCSQSSALTRSGRHRPQRKLLCQQRPRW